MAIQETNYAPSKKLYAIDWDSFTLTEKDSGSREIVSATVKAIWTTRKNGVFQVSKGTLDYTFRTRLIPAEEVSIEGFMEHFDSRYGGHAGARWDGEYMWAPNTTLKDMVRISEELDPMLAALPEVPSGYAGWYKLL